MKIGIITPWIPNGHATLSSQLARYFTHFGHEVQILPYRDDHHSLFDHGEEKEWFEYRGSNVETFFYQFQPDYCILMHMCPYDIIHKAEGRTKLIPLMMYESYTGWHNHLDNCYKVVLPTKTSAAYARQFNENVHCVPWCLLPSPTPPANFQIEPIRLLYVANIPHERRRGDYAFRAVHDLMKENAHKVQLTVRWVMKLYDRDQEYFKSLFDDYGASIEVTAGFNSRYAVLNDYHRSDILLYPSEYDGLGITPMEAQHAGCCVVAFDTENLRETIFPGADLVPSKLTGHTAEGIERRTPTYEDWYGSVSDAVYDLQTHKQQLLSWQQGHDRRMQAFHEAWQEILV